MNTFKIFFLTLSLFFLFPAYAETERSVDQIQEDPYNTGTFPVNERNSHPQKFRDDGNDQLEMQREEEVDEDSFGQDEFNENVDPDSFKVDGTN